MSLVQEKSKPRGMFPTECVLHLNHCKSKALNNFPSCLSCCLAGSLLPSHFPQGERLVVANVLFPVPLCWSIPCIKHTMLTLFYFLIKQVKCYTYDWNPLLVSVSLFFFIHFIWKTFSWTCLHYSVFICFHCVCLKLSQWLCFMFYISV